MKIIQETCKTFENEISKKERQITVLSQGNIFIVLKLDTDKDWNGTSNISTKAYSFDDEKKVHLWVDKLCKDVYL